MKRIIITLVLFTALFSVKTNAQKYTKGYMKFEISDFKADKADDPQMQMVENMIKGTTTKLYFKKDKALTKINSMGGMSIIKILVDNDGNSEMYMEMMGQKFLIKMDKKKTEELKKDQNLGDQEYVHHKDKTKDILGMKAHLVTVKTKDQEPQVEIWVTEDIDTKAMVQQGMDNDEIGGFPLEYTVTIPGQFSMTTKAVKFKDSFDDSVFDFDKKGYQEKTIEELKNMGMGGGGF